MSVSLVSSISPASLIAGSNLTPQQLNLTTYAKPSLGASIFPPQGSTLATATQPPLAAFGASILNAILPTNQPAQVLSPLSQTPVTSPGAPSSAGQNTFAASYAPEIYAVYLNGLVATTGVNSAALETDVWQASPGNPPISSDPLEQVPGAPPVQPVPAAEGVQAVIQAIAPLAGGHQIFAGSSAPVPTAGASTGGHQTAAPSHSPTPSAKK